MHLAATVALGVGHMAHVSMVCVSVLLAGQVQIVPSLSVMVVLGVATTAAVRVASAAASWAGVARIAMKSSVMLGWAASTVCVST